MPIPYPKTREFDHLKGAVVVSAWEDFEKKKFVLVMDDGHRVEVSATTNIHDDFGIRVTVL